MRRSSGFTMVEILVALSLSGLLIAGAFQIHAVFNVQSMRQKQVDDMQQSLRIAMQTIERTIRASGSGMVNGHMKIVPGCAGNLDIFRVQYYDGPAAWPATLPINNGTNSGFDTASGNTNALPDVLRVLTSTNQGSVMASTIGVNSSTVMSPNKLDGVVLYKDFALFVNTQIATAKTATGCLRQLTDTANPPLSLTVGNNFSTILNYSSAGGTACANTNSDGCMSAIGAATTPVRFVRSETYFRVLPPTSTTDTPKLSVMVVPIGQMPSTNYSWNMIADDIEDMQIALVMNDGRVCNDHDEPYPLFLPPPSPAAAFTSCDPSQAAAVRVTLTARTNTVSPGVTAMASYKGGYEDSPSSLANDGRLRRSLTSEMTLRN